MTQADIYTYRTDDYMWAVGQDYRKGRRGFSSMYGLRRWGKSGCIYEFPGSEDISRPNQFGGNLFLPSQSGNSIKNVVMCDVSN